MKRSRQPRAHAPTAAAAPAVVPPNRRAIALAVLALATLAIFSGVLRNEWTFTDDAPYIFENPHVVKGLTPEGMAWAWRGPHGGNWHPLTSLVHMANVSLFGLQPTGHHAVNLALHALNAMLVALVGFAYTRAWWRSLLMAALFALHPQRVESVAWAAELKDVLSAAFFLLTLLAYRRWVALPSSRRYAAVLATFALALLAKPMAVTLPLVLLLLDAWPLRRLHGQVGERVLEKWPLYLMVLGDAFATVIAQRKMGAISSIATLGMGHQLANAAVSVWAYLGKAFWPLHLAIFYPHVPIAWPAAVAAAAAIAAVTFLVLAWRRDRPALAVGWLWYLVMLLPVLGLVQVGGQAYADRYTYLPILGILMMLVWGIGDLVANRPAARGAIVAGAVLLLGWWSVLTVEQIGRWHDTRSIYEHALAVTADNPMSECSLGTALMETGEFPAAIDHLQKSLRMAPEFSYAHDNLGRALVAVGRPAEAIPHLERALATLESARSRDFLGSAYSRIGRLDQAVREYRAALRLAPGDDLTLFHLGQAYATQGRYAEAESFLAQAADRAPADLERRRQLAMALLFGGKPAASIEQYRRILAARPNDADALTRIAWTLATHPDPRVRNGAEAVSYAEKARAASGGGDALIESVFAAACAEAGRMSEAQASAQRALRMATAAGDSLVAARVGGQLREYRAGRPLRAAP